MVLGLKNFYKKNKIQHEFKNLSLDRRFKQNLVKGQSSFGIVIEDGLKIDGFGLKKLL